MRYESPAQVKEALRQALTLEAERRGDKWRPGGSGRAPEWTRTILSAFDSAGTSAAATGPAPSAPVHARKPLTPEQVGRMWGGLLEMLMTGASYVVNGEGLPTPIEKKAKDDLGELCEPWVNEHLEWFGTGIMFAFGTAGFASPHVIQIGKRYRTKKKEEELRRSHGGQPPQPGGGHS